MKYSKSRTCRRQKKAVCKRPKRFYGRLRRDLPKVKVAKQPLKYSMQSQTEDIGYNTTTTNQTNGIVRRVVSVTTPAYYVQNLTAIDQGTTYTTRQGQKIIVKRIQAKIGLEYFDVSERHVGSRIMIIQDKYIQQPANGLDDFSVTDILSRGEGEDTNSASPAVWFQNPVNMKRFKILYDSYSRENIVSHSASYPAPKLIKINKKLSIPVEYDTSTGANSGDLNNCVGNAIYLLLLPHQENSGGLGNLTMNLQTRVDFVDA